MSDRLPLALDAMGGDSAPREVVAGGIDYARDTGRRVSLVGQPDVLEPLVAELAGSDAPVSIVPASEVIDFGEKIASIRKKRDSSIRVGVRLVRDEEASAFVSAGHTGAVMALSKLVYGLIEGVERPALPAPLPRRQSEGSTILLDAGANVDCRPEHFRQFAVMGAGYSRGLFGVRDPKVGLLSIGEEDSKGTEALREVARILRETDINFVGNVEGNALFTDVADVVVCDGFVGNIALKVAEGVAETLFGLMRDEVRAGSVGTMLGAIAMRPALRSLKRRIDYAETGGVPLLGLKSISVVAHGRSNARAIRSALRVADHSVRSGLVATLEREIAVLQQAEERLASK